MSIAKTNAVSASSIITVYDHALSKEDIKALKSFTPGLKVTPLKGLFGARLTEMYATIREDTQHSSWVAYTISSRSVVEYLQLATTGLKYVGTYNEHYHSAVMALVARYDFVSVLDEYIPIILYKSMDTFNPAGQDGGWHSADFSNIIKGVVDAETQNIMQDFAVLMSDMKFPK